MATQYTSLLGLALPVTGELSGTWGDTVNNAITSLLDSAVAGTTTLSTDGDVTLTTTTGAANQSRQAILLCSGARTALRTITAPAQSKIYTVINATTGGYSVKVVGVGPTTGVTIVAGESAVIAWNGSDFIKISNTGGSASFTNVTVSGTTTLSGLTASTALALNASKEVVSVTNTGTGNNVLSASPTLTGTVAGASLQLSSLTSGRVTYAGASGLLQDSTNLTFNGTTLTANTLNLTNALGVAYGGTGLTSGTSGGVLYYSASGVLASSAALAANALIIGGGAGVAPSTITTGTGVVTALGVNTGSAGAFVVNGGALGTPSSGTVTNLTGTASININGTVGATTPTTGAFTTLTTSSTVTLNGGTANGVAYLNGSKVLTTGSALTFDGTNLGVGTAPVAIGGGYVTLAINGSTGSFSEYQQAGSGLFRVGSDSSLGGFLFTRANNAIRFGINDSEQMRLTSTGLGIGTSSPATKLHASIADATIVSRMQSTGSATEALIDFKDPGTTADYKVRIGSNGDNLRLYAGGSTRVTIDASGNLGLGVTPSAWSGITALQIAAGGAIASDSSTLDVTANAYYNAGYKYIRAQAASRYTQTSGAHQWFNASSGTVGSAISFTQAMTLDALGNWYLGTTNGSVGFGGGKGALVQVNGQMSNAVTGAATNCYHQRDTSGNYFTFWYGTLSSTPSGVGSISTTGSATAYNTSSDYRLKNITGPITNSGAYIDSLNPVEGTWKADGSTFVGLIAHEVQEASRTSVATGVKDGEEMQAMDYSNSELIANMIAELKSLRARVAQLESK